LLSLNVYSSLLFPECEVVWW